MSTRWNKIIISIFGFLAIILTFSITVNAASKLNSAVSCTKINVEKEKNKYFKIENQEQFEYLYFDILCNKENNELYATSDRYFYLACDVDFTTTTSTQMISVNTLYNYDREFNINFNGQNHTIKNFKQKVTTPFASIFGVFTGYGEITNITFENCQVVNENYEADTTVAGIAFARMNNASEYDFDNITVKNSLVASSGYAAGIVGLALGGKITNCYVNNSTIYGGIAAGGIAAFASNSISICKVIDTTITQPNSTLKTKWGFNMDDVSSNIKLEAQDAYLGGIVAPCEKITIDSEEENASANLDGCHFMASTVANLSKATIKSVKAPVSGSTIYISGFGPALHGPSNYATISSCYFFGNITTTSSDTVKYNYYCLELGDQYIYGSRCILDTRSTVTLYDESAAVKIKPDSDPNYFSTKQEGNKTQLSFEYDYEKYYNILLENEYVVTDIASIATPFDKYVDEGLFIISRFEDIEAAKKDHLEITYSTKGRKGEATFYYEVGVQYNFFYATGYDEVKGEVIYQDLFRKNNQQNSVMDVLEDSKEGKTYGPLTFCVAYFGDYNFGDDVTLPGGINYFCEGYLADITIEADLGTIFSRTNSDEQASSVSWYTPSVIYGEADSSYGRKTYSTVNLSTGNNYNASNLTKLEDQSAEIRYTFIEFENKDNTNFSSLYSYIGYNDEYNPRYREFNIIYYVGEEVCMDLDRAYKYYCNQEHIDRAYEEFDYDAAGNDIAGYHLWKCKVNDDGTFTYDLLLDYIIDYSKYGLYPSTKKSTSTRIGDDDITFETKFTDKDNDNQDIYLFISPFGYGDNNIKIDFSYEADYADDTLKIPAPQIVFSSSKELTEDSILDSRKCGIGLTMVFDGVPTGEPGYDNGRYSVYLNYTNDAQDFYMFVSYSEDKLWNEDGEFNSDVAKKYVLVDVKDFSRAFDISDEYTTWDDYASSGDDFIVNFARLYFIDQEDGKNNYDVVVKMTSPEGEKKLAQESRYCLIPKGWNVTIEYKPYDKYKMFTGGFYSLGYKPSHAGINDKSNDFTIFSNTSAVPSCTIDNNDGGYYNWERIIVDAYTVPDLYDIYYYIDGEEDYIYKEEGILYGSPIELYVPEEREGYKFSGWRNPQKITTMPKHDLELHGSFDKLNYTYYKVSSSYDFDVNSLVLATEDKNTSDFLKGEIVKTDSDYTYYKFTYVGLNYKYVWVFDPITEEYKCLKYTPTQDNTLEEANTLVFITVTFSSTSSLPVEGSGIYLAGALIEVNVTIPRGYSVSCSNSSYLPNKNGKVTITSTNSTKYNPSMDIDIVYSFELIVYKLTYILGGSIVKAEDHYYNDDITVDMSLLEDTIYKTYDKTLTKMPDSNVILRGLIEVDYTFDSYPIVAKLHEGQYLKDAKITPTEMRVAGEVVEGYFEFENKNYIVKKSDSNTTVFNLKFICTSHTYMPYVFEILIEVCNPVYDNELEPLEILKPYRAKSISFILPEGMEYSLIDSYFSSECGSDRVVTISDLEPETTYQIYYRHIKDSEYCESKSVFIAVKTLSLDEELYYDTCKDAIEYIEVAFNTFDTQATQKYLQKFYYEYSLDYEESDRNGKEASEYYEFMKKIFTITLEVESKRQGLHTITADLLKQYAEDKNAEIYDLAFNQNVDTNTLEVFKNFVIDVFDTSDDIYMKFLIELGYNIPTNTSNNSNKGLKMKGSINSLDNTEGYVGSKVNELMGYGFDDYEKISLDEFKTDFVGGVVDVTRTAVKKLHACDGSTFINTVGVKLNNLTGMTYMDYKFDRAAYDKAYFEAAEVAVVAHIQGIVLVNLDEKYNAKKSQLSAADYERLTVIYNELKDHYSSFDDFYADYREIVENNNEITYDELLETLDKKLDKQLVLKINTGLTDNEIIVIVLFSSLFVIALGALIFIARKRGALHE